MHPTLHRALELIAVGSITIGLIGLLSLPTPHIATRYSVIRLVGYDGPTGLVWAVIISVWVVGFGLVRFLKRIETNE